MSTINKNLEKMLGKSEMQQVLASKSVDNSNEKNETTMDINFLYNEKGEIIIFSDSKQEGFYQGIFKININPNKKVSAYKVAIAYLDKKSPEKARNKLEETAYNHNAFVTIENHSFFEHLEGC